MAQLTTILDAAKLALETERDDVVAPPSNYRKVVLNRTLDWIQRMRQVTGEANGDYTLRIQLLAQKAPEGAWTSPSWWSQVEAAVAADHGVAVQGGLGRSKE